MAVLIDRVLGKRAQILVVDDDLQLRESVLFGLRKMGYGVEAAEDGLEALHHLQHGQFDVVVTDLQMPRLDGLALLREIQRRGYTQAVIIQTTLLDPSVEVILRHAGACGVLMKGGPFSDLVQSVEEAYRIAQGSHGSSPQGPAPGCTG